MRTDASEHQVFLASSFNPVVFVVTISPKRLGAAGSATWWSVLDTNLGDFPTKKGKLIKPDGHSSQFEQPPTSSHSSAGLKTVERSKNLIMLLYESIKMDDTRLINCDLQSRLLTNIKTGNS